MILKTHDTVRFIRHTLTNKLIGFSDGFILFTGRIDSAAAPAPGANSDEDLVGLQNNAIFKDVKVSFSNNEVEHNRNPGLSTTWLNLFEYSDEYTSSVATQWGYAKDTGLRQADNAGFELRNTVT